MNKTFNKKSSLLTGSAILATTNCEELAKKIDDGWSKAINDSSDNDTDFDVDTTISKLVDDNSDDVDMANSYVDTMKKSLNKMKESNTGKYDYDAYNNLYKHTKKYVSFVTSSYGSYNDFQSTCNELHQKVADNLDN